MTKSRIVGVGAGQYWTNTSRHTGRWTHSVEREGHTDVRYVGVNIDGSDFSRVAKILEKVPDQIRDRVLTRSLATFRRTAESKVVKKVAAETSLRQKDVRSKMTSSSTSSEVKIVVRSKWIRLTDLGSAKQTKVGVWVRGWGTHKHAFLASIYNKGAGLRAYARVGKPRFPVKALWGPNPAQHIRMHADEFQSLISSEAERRLLPEVERQLDLVLRGL
jgi:hypothetical protein